MSHPRFDTLREELLRAGIAPLHVRRYISELRQHYADLLSEEKANGVIGEAAVQAARARLGSQNDLAAAMLAKPELRSVGARFPWAVFSIAPVLTLAALLFVAVLLQIGFMKLHLALTHGFNAPDWLKSSVGAWNFAMMYFFPFVIATIFCFAAVQQRIKPVWIMFGVLLTVISGALVKVSTAWSPIPHHTAFSVSFGGSSESMPRIYASIIMAAVLMALQWWFVRRQVVAE